MLKICELFPLSQREVKKKSFYGIFTVPKYQRRYSWRELNVERLWSDINSLVRPDASDNNSKMTKCDPTKHFLGSLTLQKTYTPLATEHKQRLQQNSNPPAVYSIIDGQQRMTTITLLMGALARTFYVLGLKIQKINAFYGKEFETKLGKKIAKDCLETVRDIHSRIFLSVKSFTLQYLQYIILYISLSHTIITDIIV